MLGDAEREVLLLRAVWEVVDEAVNHSMLTILGQHPECEVRFHTAIHQRYFNIVLVDLLSKTDRDAPIKTTEFLDGLGAVAMAPKLVASMPHGRLVTPCANSVTGLGKW